MGGDSHAQKRAPSYLMGGIRNTTTIYAKSRGGVFFMSYHRHPWGKNDISENADEGY